MLSSFTVRATRALRIPPRVLLQRMRTELNVQIDRRRAPGRAARCAVAERAGATDIEELWRRLSNRIYALVLPRMSAREYERVCPGDTARILSAADAVLARRVDLLGSGPRTLGTPLDWHTDFKTGATWPLRFMRDIDCADLGAPSDVKVPWELSRLQWVLPAGQAYLLTGDERYAAGVRAILEEWIDANPYAYGVNWACTMEAAMRIVSWTWLFHAFCRSASWADDPFRRRFLQTLFLHGEFTERYVEHSDINGNHFTADAVGLVVAGLFFGAGEAPRRWAAAGWRMLCDELSRQVGEDGVDFEGSIAYHRLVLELFFLAVRYREALGLPVSDAFRDRLIAMARFTVAYSRRDGGSPYLGDADDGRTLPFGGQPLDDHRYLVGLVGAHWGVPDLIRAFSGPRAEIVWTLGRGPAASLPDAPDAAGASAAFSSAGFYVMRNDRDHVFIDCGPVGQNGRGGHGHNDCLSFDATLDGVHLVADCGSYVYTADAAERNRFRSTASHNTPQVDSEELNRFYGWSQLWTLHNDAIPRVHEWSVGSRYDRFVGSHSGYHRLSPNLTPVRTIVLDHERHVLTVEDTVDGDGEHAIAIPLHLAPGVEATLRADGAVTLVRGGREFLLTWSSPHPWRLVVGEGRVSPRYGVAVPIVRLLWRCSAPLPVSLVVTVRS